jgi:hypothetical protein
MATVSADYGTDNQSITCTITSLSSGSSRQSTAISNTSNLYLDALVFVKVKTASSATSSSGYISIYAYGTVDGGSTYSDGATGSDGSITLTSPPNMRLLGIINTVANSTTYYGGPFSVASCFGGNLPAAWGIVVVNNSGNTLDAAVGSSYYQGLNNTVA